MEFHIPKTKKAREKFEGIIKAADNEFYLNGYEKSSIANITAAAGIAVGTFYLYFKDKISLYHYILFDYQKRIKKYINARLSTCTNRYEKERMGLIAWLEFIADNPHTYNIIWQSLIIDKSLFIDYYKKFLSAYALGLIEDKDQLEDSDYETLALSLMGISSFLGLKHMIEDRKLTIEEITKMADTIMTALKQGMFKKNMQ